MLLWGSLVSFTGGLIDLLPVRERDVERQPLETDEPPEPAPLREQTAP